MQGAGERGLRAAWGAGSQMLHLQHEGAGGRGGREDREEEGDGPDLQAPGKKTQPRFMETQVTRWSRVYYPSRASECVFMTFPTILSH